MKPERAIAEEVITVSDCADRILKIVDGLQEGIRELQQEGKDREADFQARLKRAVEETQRRVEEQLRSQQERAVLEAQAATRRAVTENLLTRFDVEIRTLQANFDLRLRETIIEMEAATEAKREQAIAGTKEILLEQMREEARAEYQPKLDDSQKRIAFLEERARAASSELQAERRQFQERIATLERTIETKAINAEKMEEYKELERRLDEALQSKERLGLDLQRAVAGLNARTQSQAQDESDHAGHEEVARIVQREVARIQSLVDEIEKRLADSAIDLAVEIRLNRERAELQAYLKGLRYSLGDVTLQSSTVQDSYNV